MIAEESPGGRPGDETVETFARRGTILGSRAHSGVCGDAKLRGNWPGGDGRKYTGYQESRRTVPQNACCGGESESADDTARFRAEAEASRGWITRTSCRSTGVGEPRPGYVLMKLVEARPWPSRTGFEGH